MSNLLISDKTHDALRFMDPGTNTELESIPRRLEADPELLRGFLFLKQHASEVDVDIFLARHTRASDLGNNHEYEEALHAKKYDIVFLEGINWTKDVNTLLEATY